MAQGFAKRQNISFGRIIHRHPRAGQKARQRTEIENTTAMSDKTVGKPYRQIRQRADIDGDDAELLCPIEFDCMTEQSKSRIVDDEFDLDIVCG